MAKGTKAVAIVGAQPVLTNTISTNITQNDMVELIVQEKLSDLEDKIEKNLEKQKALGDTFKDLELIKEITHKSPEYKAFSAMLSKLDLDVSKSRSNMSVVHHGNMIETICWKVYNKQYAEGKNALTNFERQVYGHSHTIHPVESLQGTLSFESAELSIRNTIPIKLSAADKKKLVKMETDYYRAKAVLCNEYVALMKELLTPQHNERKFKAQVTKSILKNSSLGKDLLKLLEKSTGVNLLIGK